MRRCFIILGHLLLAGIFLWAGLVKIMNPQEFYESLLSFKFASDSFLAFGASTLPALEIVSALALLFSFLRQGALVLILGQFAIFQVWLGQAWARGLIQDCPCFGAEGLDIRLEFFFNCILIVISLLLLKENQAASIKDSQRLLS